MRIFKCERDGCEGIIKLGKECIFFVFFYWLKLDYWYIRYILVIVINMYIKLIVK